MKTLTFNRVHKNGWLSFKLPGVPGAVYVDKRMLSAETLASPPTSIEIEVPGMVEAGAGVSEAQAAKVAKKLEVEAKKAERAAAAAAKATARLEKLQAAAEKAQASAAAARAKSGAVNPDQASA
jgi:hypothetical protein